MGIACVAVTVALAASLAACGSGGSASGSRQTVRVGMTPYFEYQPFIIAHDLGLDHQEGLDLSFINLKADGGPVSSALANGSIDIGGSCFSCEFPYVKAVPQLRDFMITNQFKGFIVVGRKGKAQTYSQLASQVGAAQARSQVLHSFIGKSFDLETSVYKPLLDGAVQQAGIDPARVNINSFGNDAEAALAFEHGTGDYFMGGLPQMLTMLYGSSPQYVNVGGSEILGAAGLWYSTMLSTDGWLKKNHAVALKLMAIWYRTIRYINAYPDYSYAIWTKSMNQQAAADYTPSKVKFVTTSLEQYATIAQAQKGEFDPSSPLYFMRAAKYYANAKGSTLPTGSSLGTVVQDSQYFQEFLKSKPLQAWVSKPLKAPPSS